VERMLQEPGFDTISAVDGREALEVIQRIILTFQSS
jgi:hypothetical protein